MFTHKAQNMMKLTPELKTTSEKQLPAYNDRNFWVLISANSEQQPPIYKRPKFVVSRVVFVHMFDCNQKNGMANFQQRK